MSGELVIQSSGPLDALPLWGLFMAILLVVLLSVEGGYRLGKYRRSRSEQEKEAPVGTMVGATLGLLSHFGKGKALAFEATALAGVGTDMLASLHERVSAWCPHGF